MSHFDLEQSDKYCIFKCAEKAFGIPALSVRSVQPQIEITSIPLANSTFCGIAKIQQEFLPVYSLVHDQICETELSDKKLLVMDRDTGNWGLLVDQVDFLASLEVSIIPTSDSQESFVVGTASHHDQFVSVLDPELIYQNFNSKLHSFWNSNSISDATTHPLDV